MTRFAKRSLIAAGILAALFLVVAIAGIVLVRSDWFYNRVRTRLIDTVETATGGRVEIGAFRFDWKQLRAEVDGFTLHGTEPAGKPPLFHAKSVAVGLKIISLAHRDVDIQYLDVSTPTIDLIIAPDGSLNIPSPKMHHAGASPWPETVLKLAVTRFNLWNGIFAIESHQRTPFDLGGQNLNLHLLYSALTPGALTSSYRGEISAQPIDVQFPGIARTPVGLNASFSFERNRIGINAAHVTLNGADVQLAGALEDLAAPQLNVKYTAHATMASIARVFRTKLMDRGDIIVAGNAHWAGGSDYATTGSMHAYNLYYRTGDVHLQNMRADGAVSANTQGAEFTNLRFSGGVDNQPVTGRVEISTLRGPLLDLRGVTLASLGGSFQGNAQVHNLDRYAATGDFAGLDIRRCAALFTAQALPWDGIASGAANVQGSFRHSSDLIISANTAIAPAPNSVPVTGQVNGTYNLAADTVELEHSTISLPHSRADFSGTLGRTLTAHFETTDLGDILPALGPSTASLPLKLQNGSAAFDGTVSGRLDAPRLSGHLNAANVLYNADLIESVSADVDAAPDSLRVQNGAAAHGPMRAQFQGTMALRDWQAEPSGAISATAAMHDADAAGLVALLKPGAARVAGLVNATAQVSGTIGEPRFTADVSATQGAFNGEPFDRIAAHAAYSSGALQVTGGEIHAGSKQLTITGNYTHAPGHLDSGRLQFQLASNAMPLAQIHTLQEQRPGAAGTLQVNAAGTVDLAPPAGERTGYRIEDLHATANALDLRLNGQSFGNVNIDANSQNGGLHAHLDSNFANSKIQGDGQWQLTGDYPGSATIDFSQLDFAQLQKWLTPNAASTDFTGSAEGQLRIDGNALTPLSMRAELTIPKFQLAPVTQIGNAAPITLTNSGPVVARLANSVVTIASAHFKGRSTDLSLTGKITLRDKNPLDLRVDGHIDLAELHDINRDFVASGVVTADASVRGDLNSPQVNGRVQFDKATFNIAGVPNGISDADGVIAFNGDRATIQNLTGETGGGKVDLSGFITYSGGQAIFRLHANAHEVRVRKPEGVSTVANADLNFTGSTAHSMLSGSITILRTAFNPDSDFTSLLAQSAEPVQTPAAQTGLLGGLNFDVQINTSPDIQVQSTLTQDVQIDANLHLRGSASNPAVLGRVNITQGRVLFLGTKYNIDGGSVSFYNPLKIAPVLNVDLETKAQGVDITLTISGPTDHLTLIPSSDPPFTYNEIIGLLVTGRAPSSDPAMLSAQSSSTPGGYQQSGPSSLLGSAISTPVSGRLQRFFGVSSLKIDPTIPGVDANPQARLTLEQQVTPNVTFTYITNVTTSNPQIVQVEWALSKTWSVVALREENGMTGMDFFFKKRF